MFVIAKCILRRSVLTMANQLRWSSASSDSSSSKVSIVTTNEGGFLPFDTSNVVMPVDMAFSSYQTIRPSLISKKCPVIIMHEMLDSKSTWSSFAKVLHGETMRKIYAVDTRNHGDSAKTKDMTYLHLAEDIKKLMNDENVKNCFLIGQGMGGRAAMTFALAYPEMVERFVVVDASPITTSLNHIHMAKYIDEMCHIKVDANLTPAAVQSIVDLQLSKMITEPFIRYIVRKNLTRVYPGKKVCYKWKVYLPALAINYVALVTFPFLKSDKIFAKPCMFLCGERGDIYESTECTMIRKMFPQSEFVYVSKSGYWPHMENSQEFLAAILGFMKFK